MVTSKGPSCVEVAARAPSPPAEMQLAMDLNSHGPLRLEWGSLRTGIQIPIRKDPFELKVSVRIQIGLESGAQGPLAFKSVRHFQFYFCEGLLARDAGALGSRAVC